MRTLPTPSGLPATTRTTTLARRVAAGTLVTGLAAVTAGSLAGGPAAAVPAADQAWSSPTTRVSEEPTTETHRERGVVLECTGTLGAHEVYASLYENHRYGNVVQVLLDDDPALSGHGEPGDVLRADRVATAVTVDGHRFAVSGTARAVGRPTAVHEEHDDAGNAIVIDGTHRQLRHDLVARYRGERAPLTCAPAFSYRLTVATTPVV